MGPRLLQGDAVLATFCLLSRQNTEPTSKLELLALATTKPFRCLPQHHTLYMWVFSELDCPLANARALGNVDCSSPHLRAREQLEGTLSYQRAGNDLPSKHHPTYSSSFASAELPSEAEITPFPRHLTPRARRGLLIMVNRSVARSIVQSRRLLKKTFEATFSILDGALAST